MRKRVSTTSIHQFDTHRLIPSKYSPGEASVLTEIADDEEIDIAFELDGATNDRLIAENEMLPGIGISELVFQVPCYRIINASFVHAHPQGGRFNGPDRGAWYAGFELETSQAEVAFHKTVQLKEVGRFEDSVTYDDYLADFAGEFHDIREERRFRRFLDPSSYVDSQKFANELLDEGSYGLIYPSVRRIGGICMVCFRPAMVGHVRRAKTYRFTWDGKSEPIIEPEKPPKKSRS